MSAVLVLILRVLLVVALYAFLGTALWVMWKQLARAGAQVIARKVPLVRLEVRKPGQLPAARAFAQPEVILGRDPLSDLPLPDESVSARHALLSFHDGQWWIEDLGSKNGTRLNASAVVMPTVLADGDELRCGETLLRIGLGAEPEISQMTSPGGHDG